MAEDQSDKYSSCDPAAPAVNGRSERLKPWPKFLRSLHVVKLIWSCHNNRVEDLAFEMKDEEEEKEAV